MTKRPKILIDSYGDAKLGSGHLFRSAVLGKELSSSAKTIFKINSDPQVEKLFSCFNLPYISRQDLKQIIKKEKPDILIIDRPNKVTSMPKELKEKVSLLVALDYYRNDIDNCDLVFNMNKARKVSAQKTRIYKGFNYAIIKAGIRNLRGKSFPIAQNIKNVLITFGGSDPRNNTLKAIRLLDSLANDLNVRVIKGPLFRRFVYRSKRFNKYLFYEATNQIEKNMDWADVAICGGGTTMLELLCLGKPLLVIPQNRNEGEFVALFEKEDAIVVFRGEKDRDRAYRLLRDFDFRKGLAYRGRMLIDGKGVERIKDIILSKYRKSEKKRK